VIEAGGNAVLGYMSQFDVEGDSGIVARAYGTACRILKVQPADPLRRNSTPTEQDGLCSLDLRSPNDLNKGLLKKGLIPTSPTTNVVTIAPGMLSPFNLSSHLYRNIHGSLISNSPKNDGNFSHQLVSFGPSIEKNVNQREQQTTTRFGARLSSTDYPSTGDHFQSDVELISLKSFDEHVRVRFGGLVMAKSVKVSHSFDECYSILIFDV
jgi:hypothetical protein